MEIIHDFSPGNNNPRNSEGCFLRLKNENILFAYSRFYGEDGNDFSKAGIALCLFSPDGRKHLGEERMIFRPDDFGAQNLMCPSLIRSGDEVLLFFLVRFESKGSDGPDMVPWVCRSTDECSSFSFPERCVKRHCYLVLENDRVVKLSDGRIVLPVSEHPPKADGYAGVSEQSFLRFFVSYDNASTFNEGGPYYGASNGSCGLQEPGLVELDNGELFVFARSDTGTQWTSTGTDLFNLPQFMPDVRFYSPRSPMSVKRLNNKKYFAVYNPLSDSPESGSFLGWGGKRTPLGYKLSDDCDEFSGLTLIESDEKRGYCYTAIFAAEDFLLIAYCAGSEDDGNCLSRLRVSRLTIKDGIIN